MSTNYSPLPLSVARNEIFDFIIKHKRILCNENLQSITDEDIAVLEVETLDRFFDRITGIRTKFGTCKKIFTMCKDHNKRTKLYVTLPLHRTASELWFRCPIEHAGEVTYWYSVDTHCDEYKLTQIRMRILDRIFSKIDEFYK